MQTGQRIWKDCATCLGVGKLYYMSNWAYPTNVPTADVIDCFDCDGSGVRP